MSKTNKIAKACRALSKFLTAIKKLKDIQYLVYEKYCSLASLIDKTILSRWAFKTLKFDFKEVDN